MIQRVRGIRRADHDILAGVRLCPVVQCDSHLAAGDAIEHDGALSGRLDARVIAKSSAVVVTTAHTVGTLAPTLMVVVCDAPQAN
jgi:hypothetical protein